MQDSETAEAVYQPHSLIHKWIILGLGLCDFFLISGKFGDFWLISVVRPIVVIQKYFPVLPWTDLVLFL